MQCGDKRLLARPSERSLDTARKLDLVWFGLFFPTVESTFARAGNVGQRQIRKIDYYILLYNIINTYYLYINIINILYI